MPEPGQPINGFYDPHIHGQAGTMSSAAPAAGTAASQPPASHAPANGSQPPASQSQPSASQSQPATSASHALGNQSQPAAGMPGAPASQTPGGASHASANASQPSASHAVASQTVASQTVASHAPANGSQANATQSQANATQAAAQPSASQADAEDRPITDFARVDLQLGGAEVNGDLLAGFGRAATEAGLTPRQARALAQWHMRGVAEARDAAQAAQARELAASWGRDYEANRQQVVALCSRLDRVPGLENFSSELARSGAADNAVVVRGLRELAAMLGEDSAGTASASGQRRGETAYEGICDAFARARSGNNHIIQ